MKSNRKSDSCQHKNAVICNRAVICNEGGVISNNKGGYPQEVACTPALQTRAAHLESSYARWKGPNPVGWCGGDFMLRVNQNHIHIDGVYIGLVRTVYIQRIWPYIRWFPCQKYRIYTVYIWFWPTLYIYGIFGRKLTKHTVIHNVDIWSWPTQFMLL